MEIKYFLKQPKVYFSLGVFFISATIGGLTYNKSRTNELTTQYHKSKYEYGLITKKNNKNKIKIKALENKIAHYKKINQSNLEFFSVIIGLAEKQKKLIKK